MASPITSKIGTGITFPLTLTTQKDSKGNDLLVPKVDTEGNVIYDNQGDVLMVPQVGCYPVVGNPKLIQDNLVSLFTYHLGERFRQENFGSRLWEAIEEPNDQLLHHMMNLFIKSSVATWEPRIKGLTVNLERQNEKLKIMIQFMVDASGNVENITLGYNSTTAESYAY